MRIIGVQGRLEEEPGDGLEELMAKQCVVTEPCDAESLRTSAVDTVRSPPHKPFFQPALSWFSELLLNSSFCSQVDRVQSMLAGPKKGPGTLSCSSALPSLPPAPFVV